MNSHNSVGTVCIMMGTYNGEKYISDQLDSIIAQDYDNWHLHIRDDGSTDDTLNIIIKYIKSDNRIFLIKDYHVRNLGVAQNFSAIMDVVANKYDHYMFCDQDDVWLPQKIKISYESILNAEEKYEKSLPILVYTNFTYVDDSLNILNITLNMEPPKSGSNGFFASLFIQTRIYGCTTIFNLSLLKKCLHIPQSFGVHDYWVAFVASALGQINHINQSDILYRQHANNVTSSYKNKGIKSRILRIMDFSSLNQDLKSKYIQCCGLYERFHFEMASDKKSMLKNYIKSVESKNKIKIIYIMLKYRILRMTLLQNIFLFTGIIFSNFRFINNNHGDTNN